MGDSGDRTLPATPRRREAARRSGGMPSAAAPAWAATAATAILLGPAWLEATLPAATDFVRTTVAAAHEPAFSMPMPAALLLPTAGLVLAAGAAGLAVRVALDGFSWQPGRMVPDLRRIDPVSGVARAVSLRSLAASLGHAVGLALIVVVAWRAAAPLAAVATAGDALHDPARLLPAAWRPLAWVAAAAAVVAVVQWALARRRFEAAIRMTPQEFADEARGMQADPKVRLLQQQRRAGPAVRRPEPAPRPAPGSRSGR